MSVIIETVTPLGESAPRLTVTPNYQEQDITLLHIDAGQMRAGAQLTPRGARQLIDALEPHAAPRRTALDAFKEWPIGTEFAYPKSTPTATRLIKTGDDAYLVVMPRERGRSTVLPAEGLADDLATEVEVVL